MIMKAMNYLKRTKMNLLFGLDIMKHQKSFKLLK